MAEFALPLAEEAQGRRRQMLRTAFGPIIAAALADPTVIEVMVNPDGKLWIERAASGEDAAEDFLYLGFGTTGMEQRKLRT